MLAGAAWQLRAAKPGAGARLAQALEHLGPAYIKLGQMLANRPDIVGSDVAAALQHLQDRLPPFSDAAARIEIANAFGRPTTALFTGLRQRGLPPPRSPRSTAP